MFAKPHDEFELISRLTANLPANPDVLVGSGDDAAVARWPPGRALVATCDAQVEGRHFLPNAATPEELGARALLVNLSDIAAMGAEPRFALISLFISPSITTAWLERYYVGLRAIASVHGVSIIGGNISGTSGPFAADITLIGAIAPGRAIRRSGAQEGDAILVTGQVGGAAAGLLAATNPRAVADVSAQALARVREAWLRPAARVQVGRALAEAGSATAMIDISDGLAADLGHLLAASHFGAELEAQALPVDAATNEVAHALGRDPIELALYGGDDYELLFTAPAESLDSTIALVASQGASVTRIGWIRPPADGLQLVAPSGVAHAIEPRGWDHLRAEALPIQVPGATPDDITHNPSRDAQ
jgi:thiamine-monophosphate kinase